MNYMQIIAIGFGLMIVMIYRIGFKKRSQKYSSIQGGHMPTPVLLKPDFAKLSAVNRAQLKDEMKSVLNREVSEQKVAEIYYLFAWTYREYCRNRKEYIAKVIKKD